MLGNLVGKEKISDGKASRKFFVIAISALFIFGGLSALTSLNAKALTPTWKGPTFLTPSAITMPQTFSGVSNFSHADVPGDMIDLTSGRIYISASPGTGCAGATYDSADVAPHPMQLQTFVVSVTNYNPYGPPFNLGGGDYDVHFYVADTMGMSACSAVPAVLRITAPDNTPPKASGHGFGPPGFVGTPAFTVNPATTTTELEYTISDITTGGSFITDAEYFYCGPSVSPCGPDPSWVNDTGFKPDMPLPDYPWGGFPPPPQSWNAQDRMFLNNSIDVSLWAAGDYWFYIHGADCGENTICQGGLGDDNWGKDKGGPSDFFYELKLTVGTSLNAPVLDWTGEPGYEADGVDPDTAPAGSNFTYKIKYSDADGDPPPTDTSILVNVDKPCGSPILGSPFVMGFERWVGTPDNYTQGAVYNVTLVLSGGTYSYYFNGTDGVYWAVGAPTIPCSDGPVVTSSNNAPVLDWTGEPGYTADGVNPDTGDTTTTFEYRVEYTDADDDPPQAGYPTINIDKPCGVDWGGPFVMTEVDPLDTTYTDGKLYYYQTTLSPAAPPDYGYYFAAMDGIDFATGAPTLCTVGPTVTGPTTPPAAPPNLWVERSPPNNVIVHWDAVPNADSYNVYISTNDRFAAFPWPVTAEPTTSFVHAGALSDTNTYFYIVRALNTTNGESTNSTMGVKLYKSFGTPYSPGRNLYWMSLPYVSMYKKAKDITDELTSTNINSVCKWNPSKQNSQCYTYWAGKWRGANFDIAPGDGIMVNSINTWSWAINGTDMDMMLSFITHSKGNINWISLPYTNSYVTASDIVTDIEGSLGTANKIIVVAMWNPATQAVMRYYWSGSAWTGTDFNIMPGEGYYLEISSSFTWTPNLITPTVP